MSPRTSCGALCRDVVGVDRGHRRSARLGRWLEQHLLCVDQRVARHLGQLVVIAERDRIERARDLAVPAEDAAAHVDLVDACIALAGRVALLRSVLGRDNADAVGGARGCAERAADALLEAVLVPVQPVAPAEPRVDRALVLRVLLRHRLAEQVPEGDAESLEVVVDAHALYATIAEVTSRLSVASGSSTFQPMVISRS